MPAAVRHESDTDVEQVIDAAALAACAELDKLFPGHERDGITSNFQGLLVKAMTEMLKGRSILNDVVGHSTQLPQVLIDDAFWGDQWQSGDAFLPVVTKLNEEDLPVCAALDPHSNVVKPIETVGDAYTSFEAAATAATAYCASRCASIEEAKALGMKVRAVRFRTDAETGYELAKPAIALAA